MRTGKNKKPGFQPNSTQRNLGRSLLKEKKQPSIYIKEKFKLPMQDEISSYSIVLLKAGPQGNHNSSYVTISLLPELPNARPLPQIPQLQNTNPIPARTQNIC